MRGKRGSASSEVKANVVFFRYDVLQYCFIFSILLATAHTAVCTLALQGPVASGEEMEGEGEGEGERERERERERKFVQLVLGL